MFGKVLGLFMKPETSTRGALHVHGNAIQAGLQPKVLEKMISSPDLKRRIIYFMESMVYAYLPDPHACVSIGMTAYHNTTLLHQVTPINVEKEEMSVRPSMMLPPLSLQAPELDLGRKQRLLYFVAIAVLYLQIHTHSHTCAKNGHAGTDLDCRGMMPRELHAFSDLFLTNFILMQRTHPMVVTYNPAVMLALPCNHMLELGCNPTRCVRTNQLSGRAHLALM